MGFSGLEEDLVDLVRGQVDIIELWLSRLNYVTCVARTPTHHSTCDTRFTPHAPTQSSFSQHNDNLPAITEYISH